MATNNEITQLFVPITQNVGGASYVTLNINSSNLIAGSVIQPYVTPSNRGGVPAMNVQIIGLKEFVERYATSYTLPIASASVLGGIKVGSGLSIAPDGTLSASGGGTVLSVGALSPLFTTANPTTTPTFSLISQSQNLVFASPNGSSGVPSFRALVAADIPTGIFSPNITITTTISITTNTLDSGSLEQNGRNVMISNGINAINITCETSSTASFIASYTKLGSASITFVAGAGTTLVLRTGTAVLSGQAGSSALLTRTGNTYYLQVNNL